jgi:hypothetical protein
MFFNLCLKLKQSNTFIVFVYFMRYWLIVIYWWCKIFYTCIQLNYIIVLVFKISTQMSKCQDLVGCMYKKVYTVNIYTIEFLFYKEFKGHAI